MNRKIRTALSTFIVLSIIALAALVFIYYRADKVPKASFEQDEQVKVQIEKIRYSGTKAGRVEWELEADSARRSKDDDLTTLEKVTVTFFARDSTSHVLTADEGRFKEEAGEIEVSGNVVVRSSGGGFTIKTSSLTYFVNGRKITTEERVKMTSRGIDLEGTGLVVLVDSQSFRLLRKVKAVFRGPAV
ncbi:MAG: LPS export ABC transporter periplasmic protein LptC [Deltaproteobacteria bacterium]|nr:LPS export ABC transporter periplasmic protein LptC [Deltaproteobacteria bacterium]